ncbi:MAG: hypothetical protein ACRDYZ_04065 [Acidimicrobiales bacterium]
MGALPGGRVLTDAWFDVDAYRSSAHRRAVVWRPDTTVLVLGSTQAAPAGEPPDGETGAGETGAGETGAGETGAVPVLRRRSGGGAVLVVPGDTVWVDLWLPRGDPLWEDDVVGAAGWAGCWWAAGLGAVLGVALGVHHGPSESRPWAAAVCFAGVGPGEVLVGGRKVVGLAQWRSREGALFQGCCYRRWDPAALTRLLGIDDARGEVRRAAVGLDELAGGTAPGEEAIVAALVGALPPGLSWEVTS